ncbi:MAG: transcriptional repressor [Coriobacteriia bacterium]|nr:transcriptional repressor [Coriobacteriia bacterium]
MAQRNTVQLGIVEQALHELANHPTAEEVYLQVHAGYPTIGKATVYRALNKLVSNGRAKKVAVAGGADHYDHQVFGHYHIRCNQCGKVDDVELSCMPNIEQQVQSASGYELSGHVLLFEGTCPRCAGGERKEECCA